MPARIAVLTESEAFSAVWPRLADAVEADLLLHPSPDALGSAPDVVAVVIGAGGVEEAAVGALRSISGRVPAGHVAVVGASTEYRLVAELVRAGASEYFALPPDLVELQRWLGERVAARQREEHREGVAALQRAHCAFSRIVGNSPALRTALERVARVLHHPNPSILITGETGTGKDLVAEAIHFGGPRAREPFVPVNCSTLPAHLLEAELFGYEAGAFTGAITSKAGLFEVAHRGTLFLDEIGEMAPDLQAKLLRVLEDRQIRRLGGTRATEVDVRIIAATHVDLGARVREGSFRRDLFYRLNIVPIHLPALRERGHDVLLLAQHFYERFCKEYGAPAGPLPEGAKRSLLAQPWPGNVRQLRNAVQRAVLLSPNGIPTAEDLLDAEALETASPPAAELAAPLARIIPFPATLAAIERAAAAAAVQVSGGNKRRAATLLQISPKKLYTLLGGGGNGPIGPVAEGGGRDAGAA